MICIIKHNTYLSVLFAWTVRGRIQVLKLLRKNFKWFCYRLSFGFVLSMKHDVRTLSQNSLIIAQIYKHISYVYISVDYRDNII